MFIVTEFYWRWSDCFQHVQHGFSQTIDFSLLLVMSLQLAKGGSFEDFGKKSLTLANEDSVVWTDKFNEIGNTA